MTDGEFCAAVELRAMASAWHAMAGGWDLTWGERQELFPKGGDDLPEPPADTERRMRILLEIGYRLRFDEADALVNWLRRPIPGLGYQSPIELMGGPLANLRLVRRLADEGLLP